MQIGIWSKSGGLNITNDENEFELTKEEKIKIDDIHLRIVTVIVSISDAFSKPNGRPKQSAGNMTPNGNRNSTNLKKTCENKFN